MKHTYSVNGMTCSKCLKTVSSELEGIKGIEKAVVTLTPPQADITMKEHIPTIVMNKALAKAGKYSLTETGNMHHEMASEVNLGIEPEEEKRSFFAAYKPILLVFGYLIGITVINELSKGRFNMMSSLNVFMGGFFLVFSFFKLLDLKGFAYSYMSYDIIAKKWLGWGFIYPFIELSLGLAFLFHFDHTITNIATIVVMGVSSIGVIQSLAAKKKIQCACLGTVFNLPMSNITLIEDLLMVVMAAVMIII
ncbi:MAG: MauE/DoxX family redox-associated membrane protein [Ignavibacteria bacterium]